MANLNVRRQNGRPEAPAAAETRPLKAMRELLRWDPFEEMMPAWPTELRGTSFNPAFEVKETKESYLFKADVPGMKEEDVDVTVTGNRLTVSGKREEEREDRGETYYTCERLYGSFSRSFTLPEGADLEHIHAEMKSGVLTLVVPKVPEVQPKKIEISSAEKSSKV